MSIAGLSLRHRFRIADKSYKNYELEKRELPLSVAVKCCDEFDKKLIWLFYGNSVPDSVQSARLAGETAKAVFEYADANDKSFSSAEIQKFTRYILSNPSQRAHRRKARLSYSFQPLDKGNN